MASSRATTTPATTSDHLALPGAPTRVSFAKIRERMPHFETSWTAERGARQLKATFDRIGLTPAMFEAPPYTRLKELKHLRDTGQIDERLRWQAPAAV